MKFSEKMVKPLKAQLEEPINRVGLLAIGALMLALLSFVLVAGVLATDLATVKNASN